MDISSIAPKSRTVDITHPVTGEPVGIKFVLLPDSDEKVKKAKRVIQNRQLQSRKLNITAEQLEANSLDLLVAAIDSWEWTGDAEFRGEKPEFTAANVRTVLRDVDWIRKQVDRELGNEEAFFEA